MQKKDKGESSKKRKSRGKAKPVISDEDDETDEVWNKGYKYVNSELSQYWLILFVLQQHMYFLQRLVYCTVQYKTHVYDRKKAYEFKSLSYGSDSQLQEILNKYHWGKQKFGKPSEREKDGCIPLHVCTSVMFI